MAIIGSSGGQRSSPPDPATPIEGVAAPVKSRRNVLAAALAGLVGAAAAALGRPTETRAAAGDPLILGQTNSAGSAATRLNASSSGGAFWMTQTGSGSGVRGDSVNGHGGVFTTAHPARFGLDASNTADYGGGAAVRASGGLNTGIVVTTNNSGDVYALKAITTAPTNSATAIHAEVAHTGPKSATAAVRALNNTTTATGFGVYATAQSGIGVYGESFSQGGSGVRGFSLNGSGVYGITENGKAIVGMATGSGLAGNFDGPVEIAKHLDILQYVMPVAPGADAARLFVRDNGSGRTQLCVRFPTGVEQILATEPV